MATSYVNKRNQLFTYTGLTANENGDAIFMDGGLGSLCTIIVGSGGGTGFNGGTLTIQVSNDKTTWVTAKDIFGAACTATAATVFEISTGAQYIRPSADATISDVDITVSFY